MTTSTITGTYGSNQTPCEIYTYEDSSGCTWYVARGSCIVNCTGDPVEDGVDVETLDDVDVFSWDEGLTSEGELAEAMEG